MWPYVDPKSFCANKLDPMFSLLLKGTTFFICVSRPAHALIEASGEKKKISKKMRTSGQVRVDKYCPQQSQRNRQIAPRKQQFYGD